MLPFTWLPPRDASWLHAIDTLLGGGGLSSLGFHLGSALLGGLLLGFSGQRCIAVVYPIASVCIGSLVAITGESCTASSGTLECKPVVEWQWTLVGDVAWVVLAMASAWYQVGQISRRELRGGLVLPAKPVDGPDSPGQSPRQQAVYDPQTEGGLTLLPPLTKAEVLRYTPSPTSPKKAEFMRCKPASAAYQMEEPFSPKEEELRRYASGLLQEPLSPKECLNTTRRHAMATNSAALSARTGPSSRPPTSRRTPRDVEGHWASVR